MVRRGGVKHNVAIILERAKGCFGSINRQNSAGTMTLQYVRSGVVLEGSTRQVGLGLKKHFAMNYAPGENLVKQL